MTSIISRKDASLNELASSQRQSEEIVSVGERILVKFLRLTILREMFFYPKREPSRRSWDKLENLFETGGTLTAKVIK